MPAGNVTNEQDKEVFMTWRSSALAIALVGCTGVASSQVEQPLCAIADWEAGNCPDTAWRIRQATSAGQAQYPGAQPLDWGCSGDDGIVYCYVVLDFYLVTVIVDCVWSPEVPQGDCILITD